LVAHRLRAVPETRLSQVDRCQVTFDRPAAFHQSLKAFASMNAHDAALDCGDDCRNPIYLRQGLGFPFRVIDDNGPVPNNGRGSTGFVRILRQLPSHDCKGVSTVTRDRS
jgi:hypothetical protein